MSLISSLLLIAYNGAGGPSTTDASKHWCLLMPEGGLGHRHPSDELRHIYKFFASQGPDRLTKHSVLNKARRVDSINYFQTLVAVASFVSPPFLPLTSVFLCQ